MNTTINIQANSQAQTTQSSQAPKMSQRAGKSFQDMMKMAAKKADDSGRTDPNKAGASQADASKANGANNSGAKAETPTDNIQHTDGGEQANKGQAAEGGQDAKTLEMTEAPEDSQIRFVSVFSNKEAMLAALFGGVLIAEGESDEDTLKRILDSTKDEGAKLAAQMLLEILAANPGMTLEDMGSKLQDVQMPLHIGKSPAQDVLAMFDGLQAAAPEVKMPDTLADLKAQFKQMVLDGILKDVNVTETKTISQEPVVTQEVKLPVARTLLEGQTKFQDAVAEAQKLMKQSPAEETDGDGVKLDIEKLQSQVDAGSFLRNLGTTPLYAASETKAVGQQADVDPAEFLKQVHTGLLKGLDAGKQEFVMKLRPEGLGELTVKLAELGGKMTLAITATSAQTQKLLNAELYNLREVMKPYQVEVEQVVTAKEQASSQFSGQFGQQNFSEHQHDGMYRQFDRPGQSWNGNETEEQTDSVPLDFLNTARFTGGLNAYI